MAIPAASGYPQHSGVIIPEIWSGKILQKFYAACVMAQLCNTDYEGEIAKQGDVVKIRTTPDVIIRDYVKGQTLDVQNPEPDVIDFPIERAKYWNIGIDDIDKWQTDLPAMEDWSRDAAEQMKIEWDREFLADVYADAHPANRGATAGNISGNINLGAAGATNIVVGNGSGEVSPIAFLLRMGQVLDEQNIPDDDRKIVVPAWFIQRLKNSDIKDASLTGDGQSTLRSGRVGMVDRWEVFRSNLQPTEIQTATRCWNGVGVHKSGISFAAQLTKNEVLTQLEQTFGARARGLAVADWKVLKPDAIATYCISAGAE